MEEDFKPYTLIKSYVKNKWFVSTVLRRSSALTDTIYFETLVWELDSETKERGNLVAMGEAYACESGGMREHFRIIHELMNGATGEEA